MIDIQKEFGISPAVGILLLLGITVGISTVSGIVLLDVGESLTEPVNADVKIQEDPDGIKVTWAQSGNAEEISVQVDGEEVTRFRDVNDSVTLGVASDSNVKAVGISNSGSTQVLQQNSSNSDTRNSGSDGTYIIKENNVKTQKVTGSISLDTPVEGATVRTIKNGTVIDTTETDSTGAFSLVGESDAKVEVRVNGDIVYNGRDVYASGSELVGEDMKVEIDFDETKLVHINENKSVISTYEIRTVEELQAMKHDLDGSYEIVSDIDASDTQEWNNGNGFAPIGEFTGELDGNEHTIEGLHIDRVSSSNNGIFSQIRDGSVSDLSVVSASVSGGNYTGVISGRSIGSTSFTNLSADGSISTADNSTHIGGIAGSGEGTFINVTNNTDISASNSDEYIGGVVGFSSNVSFTNVENTGVVTGNVNTGGIAGMMYLNSTVTSTVNTGDITGRYRVGGIVGAGFASIENSHNTGDITIKISENQSGGVSMAGGIAGKMTDDSGTTVIDNSYNTGVINGTIASDVGGIVGDANSITLDLVYNTGSISQGDDIGGLVSTLDESTLVNSYNEADLINNGDSDSTAGGIVNQSYNSSISNVYNTGRITGDGEIGGLVRISNSSSDLTDSYNSGPIVGTEASNGPVGGVVGYAEDSYTIERVYNTGDIEVTDGYEIGGVAGVLKSGTVRDSYNSGSITGRDTVGGFVGDARSGSVIETGFSIGEVTLSSSRSEIGGFSGSSDTDVTYTGTYWDTDSSTQSVTAGDSTGLNTTEMTTDTASESLTEFEFNSIWETTDMYPKLQ